MQNTEHTIINIFLDEFIESTGIEDFLADDGDIDYKPNLKVHQMIIESLLWMSLHPTFPTVKYKHLHC